MRLFTRLSPQSQQACATCLSSAASGRRSVSLSSRTRQCAQRATHEPWCSLFCNRRTRRPQGSPVGTSPGRVGVVPDSRASGADAIVRVFRPRAIQRDRRMEPSCHVAPDAGGRIARGPPAASSRPRTAAGAGGAANLTIADGEFASAVAIDPRTPSTLYAAASSGDIRVIAGGFFRSVDAGATWRPFNQSLRPRDVNALAIALTGNVLYAGTRGGGVLDYSSRGNDDGPEALAVLAYLRAIT